MKENRPIIDLSGYQSFELPPMNGYLAAIPAIIVVVFTGTFLLFCWAGMNSEPSYFALCVILTLGCFWAMHFFDRNLRPVECPECGSEVEQFRADMDPSLGGFVRKSLITFSAYGRSYSRNQDGPFGATEWDRLMRGVGACQRCRRFTEIHIGFREPPSEYDRWVIHEHLYGDPIPMDLSKGQTLTQFELEESPRTPETARLSC